MSNLTGTSIPTGESVPVAEPTANGVASGVAAESIAQIVDATIQPVPVQASDPPMILKPLPPKRPASKSILKRPLIRVQKPSVPANTFNSVQGGVAPAPQKETVVKAKPTKPKATKPKATTKPTASPSKAVKRANKLIFEGLPDEKLEGGWPPGWIKRVFERTSGASKGHGDRYWYSPKESIRLRSMVEVRRFLKALSQTDGDEIAAKKIFKGIIL